jgi:hypothetical protein
VRVFFLLLQRLQDYLKHAVDVRENIVVPKADHAKSAGLQPRRSAGIHYLFMLPTIDLNNQSSLETTEVRDRTT